jgi:hypothetical protein
MDEHLDGLSKHVHEVLKRLKMDETGSIPVTKEYPAEEIRLYATAYAMHKNKWFEIKHDKASNTMVCKRTEQPDWELQAEIDKDEEL